MVDAEQRLERVLVHASEELAPGDSSATTDESSGPRSVFRLPRRRTNLQFLAVAVPQLPPDAKLVVGMDEVVGRQVRKAKEQVRQGPQRRRLARLVGAVDQVQALFAPRKDPARRR